LPKFKIGDVINSYDTDIAGFYDRLIVDIKDNKYHTIWRDLTTVYHPSGMIYSIENVDQKFHLVGISKKKKQWNDEIEELCNG
jgi:hypothetical protein